MDKEIRMTTTQYHQLRFLCVTVPRWLSRIHLCVAICTSPIPVLYAMGSLSPGDVGGATLVGGTLVMFASLWLWWRTRRQVRNVEKVLVAARCNATWVGGGLNNQQELLNESKTRG